jgi:hypothetical protein
MNIYFIQKKEDPKILRYPLKEIMGNNNQSVEVSKLQIK